MVTGQHCASRRSGLVSVDLTHSLTFNYRVVLCTSKGGDSKAQAGWHEVIFDDSAAPSSKTAEQDMAEKSRIQNLLGSYASELSKKMIPGRSVVLQGDARQALVGKAQELHADVMIMGSRGMAGIKKYDYHV